MVANIRSGSSPGGALRYNKEKIDKYEAEVLFWQKMLEPFDKHGRMDIDTCMESFRPYLEANRRTTNTVFHASLNPSPEDKLTDDQLRDIAQEYMDRMGYGEQPYIVFKHKDISREHLHIVSLRVDELGRKISDSHEYDRSMSVLRELERKYGLHPSVKGEEQRDTPDLWKVNYKAGNVKQQISSVVRSCLRNYRCSSYGEFRTLLELFNISVEERTGTIVGRDYAGVIYGALTDNGYGIGTPIKSSRIGKDVGYKALQKYYENSKIKLKEDGNLDRLRQTVNDAMSPNNTRDEFRRLLKAESIDTVFRINPADRIYGVTFIDHTNGIVAKGSVLGKEFSARVFNELYPTFQKEALHTAEQHAERQYEQRSRTANPVSGVVDTLLDLADARAFEEQQRIQRRRRKRKQHR
ncbi:conjugal transfer protein MobB [Alistipes shahii]|uniref:conjugal transfer protein MobB n=1 Tax=Alistipes shahii TaxID=328814 RepID=UPI00266BF385|nr:conjugal transfer protein MobB [Alistipes shahii]